MTEAAAAADGDFHACGSGSVLYSTTWRQLGESLSIMEKQQGRNDCVLPSETEKFTSGNWWRWSVLKGPFSVTMEEEKQRQQQLTCLICSRSPPPALIQTAEKTAVFGAHQITAWLFRINYHRRRQTPWLTLMQPSISIARNLIQLAAVVDFSAVNWKLQKGPSTSALCVARARKKVSLLSRFRAGVLPLLPSSVHENNATNHALAHEVNFRSRNS